MEIICDCGQLIDNFDKEIPVSNKIKIWICPECGKTYYTGEIYET